MSTDNRHEGQGGFARLWRAFLHPSRSQFVVAVLLAALAFAAVTQVRERGQDDDYSGLSQQDLVQALTGLNAASARADQELADLEEARAELSSSTERRAAALAQARQELETLSILAGTVPAHGPGIVMEVKVGDEPLGVNQLIDCIQELRDAGAEAIAINGAVRVVASTSFEEGEVGITADGRQLAPPYRITAIGDATTLETAMNILGGFVDDVEVAGGSVEIEQRKEVTIDAVQVLEDPEFSEPVS